MTSHWPSWAREPLGGTEVTEPVPAPCRVPGLAFVCSVADHPLLGAHRGPEKGWAADHPWRGSPGVCQGQARGQEACVRVEGHRSWAQAGTGRPQGSQAPGKGLAGLERSGWQGCHSPTRDLAPACQPCRQSLGPHPPHWPLAAPAAPRGHSVALGPVSSPLASGGAGSSEPSWFSPAPGSGLLLLFSR